MKSGGVIMFCKLEYAYKLVFLSLLTEFFAWILVIGDENYLSRNILSTINQLSLSSDQHSSPI
jgi:hypothetical protein